MSVADGSFEPVDTEAGRFLLVPADGDRVATADDALDLISAAFGHDAAWVVVPQERLDDAFFRLRTGVAGAITQRFANYRLGLAVVGDISWFTEASPTLRDLVRESNAGRQLWFVRDRAELDQRIAASSRGD